MTRHAKRYELGGRRHFEKIRLKVNVASRKNSTPKRVSKRSLTSYKTGSKAFFMLRFSANRLSNILYDIKCSLLNVRKLKLGRESSMIRTIYTGVTNYRCTYCLRQSIKQTILQKPINNVLFNYLFIPSMNTNDICFKIKFNLLKT